MQDLAFLAVDSLLAFSCTAKALPLSRLARARNQCCVNTENDEAFDHAGTLCVPSSTS